jgi:multicomponent Na+:H+ antiporter subunit G
MNAIVGNIIIALGLVFIFFGVLGIIKYKNFYIRLLVTSKIDIVGVNTIIIGIAVKHGFGFFTLKMILLIALLLIIDPLTAHIIARSAHSSGYQGDDGGA